MNDSERRRRQLLINTRNLYSERKGPPAVHPRYGAVYSELYGDEEAHVPGTFGIRAMLCFLLFTAFVAMDYRGIEVASVNTDTIIDAVEYQIDAKEVWNSL